MDTDQQVEVTVTLTLSVDMQMTKREIEIYAHQNIRFSNNCQFHMMHLSIGQIKEEAEIYSPDNHCNHEKNCTKNH